jgi:hypothetical protein
MPKKFDPETKARRDFIKWNLANPPPGFSKLPAETRRRIKRDAANGLAGGKPSSFKRL